MKQFIFEIFGWWHKQTMGTRFFTWRKGTKVGEDELGNVYYKGPKMPYGLERRWVIYNGPAEASAIPPGWHGWMHHRTDSLPTDQDYKAREWQKAHRANPTGSANAYHPQGSLSEAGERPRVTGDYDAWVPGE